MSKCNRIDKFVDNYVVFDFETTGINLCSSEIIEIGAIKVEDNCIVEEFETLVQPYNSIPSQATKVNGLTNEMVENQPYIEDVLDKFLGFINDSVLVGHNIGSFDLNILNKFTNKIKGFDIEYDYVDSLYLARYCIEEIDNYKLTTLCDYFGVDSSNAHRALDDCKMTKQCYDRLKLEYLEHGFIKPALRKKKEHKYQKNNFTEETKALQTLQDFMVGVIADNVITEEEFTALKGWLDEHGDLAGNYPFDRVYCSVEKVLEDGVIEQSELDELLILYKKFTSPIEDNSECEINEFTNKHFCLTGDFEIGSKDCVGEMIESLDGVIDSNVKKATNYVVVGAKGSDNWKCGNFGGKIKKAMELKEKGQDIEVISEEGFIRIYKETSKGAI